MTAIQALAKRIVAGDAPILTDAERAQLLGALLQGDLGGSAIIHPPAQPIGS